MLGIVPHTVTFKGERYWKTIFKGVKRGTKTKTSHIILFFHWGLQLKEISSLLIDLQGKGRSLLIVLQGKGRSLVIDVGGREEDWS